MLCHQADGWCGGRRSSRLLQRATWTMMGRYSLAAGFNMLLMYSGAWPLCTVIVGLQNPLARTVWEGMSVYLCFTKYVLILLLMSAGSSDTQDFCQSETFRPQCLPGEAVIITKAVYGRMSHDSRCLQNEDELPTLKDDPKYMGCFEDVLPLVTARCSGQSDCEIRIPDPEMEQSNPCYNHMFKYLVVAYRCITGISCHPMKQATSVQYKSLNRLT